MAESDKLNIDSIIARLLEGNVVSDEWNIQTRLARFQFSGMRNSKILKEKCLNKVWEMFCRVCVVYVLHLESYFAVLWRNYVVAKWIQHGRCESIQKCLNFHLAISRCQKCYWSISRVPWIPGQLQPLIPKENPSRNVWLSNENTTQIWVWFSTTQIWEVNHQSTQSNKFYPCKYSWLCY